VSSSTTIPVTPAAAPRSRILLCFACVYLFWGGTYLAMRFGVQVLPPFVLAATRFMISGPLMLAFCLVRGVKIKPTRWELGMLVLIGVVMLSGGNTAVLWSEQYLPSGLTALLYSAIPIYAALAEVFLRKGEGLAARGWVGIAIGFAGLVLLVSPGFSGGVHGDGHQAAAIAVTLFGTVCWTSASVLSRHTTIRISGFAAAGWEMLFAGLFNTGMMLVAGGYKGGRVQGHWGAQAWLSVLYLVVFGSLVGYTAYLYLLDNVAVSKVATYAYVNPVIAVVAGAVFLAERLTKIEYAGMAAVLVAVFLVNSSKMSGGETVADVEVTEFKPLA
jgi:drug/metabolite transporter (DMT)-like permease